MFFSVTALKMFFYLGINSIETLRSVRKSDEDVNIPLQVQALTAV